MLQPRENHNVLYGLPVRVAAHFALFVRRWANCDATAAEWQLQFGAGVRWLSLATCSRSFMIIFTSLYGTISSIESTQICSCSCSV
jgi:hypothetical protein